jgi:hypothetical protein
VAVVRDVLATIRSLVGQHDDVVVVSPLAEGADRLVAATALDFGLRLECVLPLTADEYEQDFASRESVERFRQLLERAASVRVVPDRRQEDRPVAYADAGQTVVERSDVLIAIWDGRPSRGRGGTAEIVDAASAVGRAVVWVHAEPPYAVRVLGGSGHAEIAAALRDHLEAHDGLGA